MESGWSENINKMSVSGWIDRILHLNKVISVGILTRMQSDNENKNLNLPVVKRSTFGGLPSIYTQGLCCSHGSLFWACQLRQSTKPISHISCWLPISQTYDKIGKQRAQVWLQQLPFELQSPTESYHLLKSVQTYLSILYNSPINKYLLYCQSIILAKKKNTKT